MRIIYFLLLCTTSAFQLPAQTNPIFDKFQGEIYSIPVKKASKDYGPHIYDFKHIGSLEWEEINVPESEMDVPFPDVSKKSLFGIVFNSIITIEQDGCYEFSLNSDDGSKLWIEEQIVINNGGNHGMKLKKDSFALKKGSYPAKIWYQQLYPNKYGVIFKSNYAGTLDLCSKELEATNNDENKKIEKLVFSGNVLYETNSFKIKNEAFPIIDTLCQTILSSEAKKITFIGHTDDIGSTDSNINLSNKRAQYLMELVMRKVNKVDVQYRSIGKGESEPIATNDSEDGRIKNRRVEIILE